MSIQVALVSDQLLPTLIAALAERPRRVFLVTSAAMSRKGLDQRLARLLDEQGVAAEICPRAPDTGLPSIHEFASRLGERLRREHSAEELVLNATGGNKLMMLGFYGVFRDIAARILYVDTQHHRMEMLPGAGDAPAHPSAMRGVLDVPLYLAARGFDVSTVRSDNFTWRERAASRRCAAMHLAHDALRLGDFVRRLNTLALGALDARGYELARPVRRLSPIPSGRKARALALLDETAVVRWGGGAELEFPDAESARFVGGGWLEEYIWHALADARPDDVRLGVEGTWENVRGVRNEFDLLSVHRNELLVVECKTEKHGRESARDAEVLYKLDSLAAKARGLFGRVLLACARPPPRAMLERAGAYGIDVVGPRELPGIGRIIRDWMGGEAQASDRGGPHRKLARRSPPRRSGDPARRQGAAPASGQGQGRPSPAS